VTSDANMNVAQWFDYAPYGSVLATTNTGATKAGRQYIGQFTDDSGLSYLNARYFNSGRGQFITEDPTFLALGTPNQLQQLSQDQLTLISDPQQLNSYSYGRNNPVTNEDPQGLWAFQFGIAGTIPGGGLSGQIGIQADLQGVEYYYGAGLAGGGGISFGPKITTADLSHQYQMSTEGFAQGGVLLSVEVAKGMTYYPYSNRKPNSYQDATIGFPAAELAGGVMSIVSGPIPFLTWSSPQNINYALPKPQMNGVGGADQSLFYAGVTQKSPQTSVSGGGSSSGSSYGSPGTTYTSFEPGNTHSACGALCE
jgi:RHS repeat-associated protein